MEPTLINSLAQLTIQARPTQPKTSGALTIGGRSTAKTWDATTQTGYARRVLICDTSGTGVIDLSDGTATGSAAYVSPVAQVETVVATGTVTSAGTLNVTVTGGGLASPKVIPVNILGTPTASTWAATVRTALGNSTDISALFTVGGTGANISLTRIIDDYGFANDGTFDISIAAGTVGGITPTSSTTTTNGSLATGVLWSDTTSVDAEGLPLPALEAVAYGLMAEASAGTGSGSITDTSGQSILQTAGSIALVTKGSGSDGFATEITFECITPPYDVTFTIVSKID